MDTEIIPIQTTSFLSPAASIAQLRERYKVFNQFVKDILHAGVDYQTIPGTDKPSLVKPGAEKLATLFGLSARFTAVEKVEDWTGIDHGNEPFFYYVYRCELYRGELFVASCDGSCNSREKKYRYRNADRVCPTCGKPTIFKSKQKPEWYCWTKKGGCGATFTANDKRITDQGTGQVPNPDIADQVNTLQKMAQKRAFVGAVLIATNASEYFTQDVEEMPGFVEAVYEEIPAVKATATTKPTIEVLTANGEAAQDSLDDEVRAGSNGDRPTAKTNGNGHNSTAYTGTLAKLGKHQYPAEWCRMLAAYKRVNVFEVDGILQKLNLPATMKPEDVVAEINLYLDEKEKNQTPEEILKDLGYEAN